MKRLSGKLTYANVISTLALFLVVAGGSAFAANQLAKNSVGANQLKKNAVTSAKVKANAVTAAKIKKGSVNGSKIAAGGVGNSNLAAGAVTGEKIANGTITGDKVNVGTLPTVPSSATTNVVKGAKGTLTKGQEAVIFTYGPFAITAQCREYAAGELGERFLISSSTSGSVFTSWRDGSSNLGPSTPEEERELSYFDWANSSGPFEYENPADTGFSASSTGGQALNGFIGEANELNSNTCWYWLTANIIS